ncbi:hypothetical protein FACS1894132_04450 [Clostridia bacterium]|nr:hypothetical protein FACS1894132_04450 [Clostridia bacterium]
MPKMPLLKGKDFLDALVKFGCVEVSIRGSHHKIKNLKNNKITVIPIHSGDDIPKPFALKILNQLEINAQDFIDSI